MAIFLAGQKIERSTAAWQQAFSGQSTGLKFVISTRTDGNMSFKYGTRDEVRQNRDRLFRSLGLSSDRVVPLSLDVAYGVHWLDRQPEVSGISEVGFEAEGVWLTDASLVPFLFVADCFPLGCIDRNTGAVGIFHAGRAELEAGLLKKFFELGQAHGVEGKHLRVFIGPGICSAHYVFQDLPAGHTGVTVLDSQGQHHLDLRADIRHALASVGVNESQIVEDGRCTYESPELFSHRREQGINEGRFALLLQRHG